MARKVKENVDRHIEEKKKYKLQAQERRGNSRKGAKGDTFMG